MMILAVTRAMHGSKLERSTLHHYLMTEWVQGQVNRKRCVMCPVASPYDEGVPASLRKHRLSWV
jgi:hypothetical protein